MGLVVVIDIKIMIKAYIWIHGFDEVYFFSYTLFYYTSSTDLRNLQILWDASTDPVLWASATRSTVLFIIGVPNFM